MTASNLAAPTSIQVALGNRSYEVLIGRGLLPRAAALIGERIGKARCAIVTDSNVAQHHLATLQEALRAQGLHAGTEVLAPGEATKSFAAMARLCERLLEMGLERGDLVVALLKQIDANVPVRQVRATRGKWVRAEPVAALYAEGRVSHAGRFDQLEDQMCALGHDGLARGRSPDRLDALVWALTALTFGARGEPRVRGL